MPMTAAQIVGRSLPNRRMWSENVAIRSAKVKKNKEGKPMVVAQTRSLTGNDDKPKKTHFDYVTTLELYPKENVIVSCSCEDFLYTWEVALALKNAARTPEYSNGAPPENRNPSNRPGACKHILALIRYLQEKGKL